LFYPKNYFFSVKKKTNYDISRRLAEPQSSTRIKALRCCAAWHRISPQIGSRELSGQGEGFRQQKQESRWTTDHFTSLEPRDNRETASV